MPYREVAVVDKLENIRDLISVMVSYLETTPRLDLDDSKKIASVLYSYAIESIDECKNMLEDKDV